MEDLDSEDISVKLYTNVAAVRSWIKQYVV